MSSAIDGELDVEQSRLLGQHLEACESCRADFAVLKQTVSLLQDVPALEPPADLLAGVRSRLGKKEGRLLTGFIFGRPQVRAALAAGVVAMLCVFALQRDRSGAGDQGSGVRAKERLPLPSDNGGQAGERRQEAAAPVAPEAAERDEAVSARDVRDEAGASDAVPREPAPAATEEDISRSRRRRPDVGGGVVAREEIAPVTASDVDGVPQQEAKPKLVAPGRSRGGKFEKRANKDHRNFSAETTDRLAQAEAEGEIWGGAAKATAEKPGLRAVDVASAPVSVVPISHADGPAPGGPQSGMEPALQLRVVGATEADVLRVAREVLGDERVMGRSGGAAAEAPRKKLWFGTRSRVRAEEPLDAVASEAPSDKRITLTAAKTLFLRIPAADYPRLLEKLKALGKVREPVEEVSAGAAAANRATNLTATADMVLLQITIVRAE